MPQSRWFRIGYGIALILLIILLVHQVWFVFYPLVVLVETLFFPFLLAGVLYYLFRPLVLFLDRKRIPRTLSILALYLMAVGVFILVGVLVGPAFNDQVEQLVQNFPSLAAKAQHKFLELEKNPWLSRYIKSNVLLTFATGYLKTSWKTIVDNVAHVIGVFADVVVTLVTVPFILFYMLKEGEKFSRYVLRIFPEREKERVLAILSEMDTALSSYIKGQVLVGFFVGLLVWIGFLIIGLDYSLILGLARMFTNVIPVVGPIISTIPAFIVGWIESPAMAFKVLIVVLVVHVVEVNLISPWVMGRSLNIHPLTMVLLLLVAGSLGGFLGLLLAVPTYAVLKVIVQHTYRLVQLKRDGDKTA
jgi:predicted PurR-regulated permease PerM